MQAENFCDLCCFMALFDVPYPAPNMWKVLEWGSLLLNIFSALRIAC